MATVDDEMARRIDLHELNQLCRRESAGEEIIKCTGGNAEVEEVVQFLVGNARGCTITSTNDTLLLCGQWVSKFGHIPIADRDACRFSGHFYINVLGGMRTI